MRLTRILPALHGADRGGLKKEKDGQRIPSIVFTKNGGLWLEKIAAIGCDAIGLDWTIDIGEARRRVGDKVALQGNLDPNVLFASPEVVAAEAKKVLDSFGPGNTGHVFNLGHGISSTRRRKASPPWSRPCIPTAVYYVSNSHKWVRKLDLYTEFPDVPRNAREALADPGIFHKIMNLNVV